MVSHTKVTQLNTEYWVTSSKSQKSELIEVTYIDLKSGQEKKKSMSRQELKESGFDWVDDREDIDSCIVFE